MKKSIVILFFLLAQITLAQAAFSTSESQRFQTKINAEYADAATSPLLAEDLKDFQRLAFYSIDEKFIVTAKLIRSKGEKPFDMNTSTARTPKYIKYGTLYFSIDEQNLKLSIYQNIELSKKPGYEEHLFLPFSDLTSGKESYIGGKYIDLKIPKDDTIVIDFNQSYNPYCAYNSKYSCPIVPLENDLNVAIEAGVKKFHN
ncbi:DUF1684 domain-containing protein [Flavobacterium sp. TMP13]|uniref:DUF1684 domain-containing protein n=1 Tax=Flavobacterium sp. TMP13 TaxID=3425950 RepID=UPI003D788C6A